MLNYELALRVGREVREMEGEQEVVDGEGAAEMLARAVGRYREVMAALPGLVPELGQGGAIEGVDAAVPRAREAYEAVSRRVAEAQEARIPVGNPARSAADLAAANLRPEAKIALGLRKF